MQVDSIFSILFLFRIVSICRVLSLIVSAFHFPHSSNCHLSLFLTHHLETDQQWLQWFTASLNKHSHQHLPRYWSLSILSDISFVLFNPPNSLKVFYFSFFSSSEWKIIDPKYRLSFLSLYALGSTCWVFLTISVFISNFQHLQAFCVVTTCSVFTDNQELLKKNIKMRIQ